jgi:hypothetical protein
VQEQREEQGVENHEPGQGPRRDGAPARAPSEGDDVRREAEPDEAEQRTEAQRDAHPLVHDADRHHLTDHRGPAQLDEPRQVDPVAMRDFEGFGAHLFFRTILGVSWRSRNNALEVFTSTTSYPDNR